jgi:hypothetical protein
MKQWINDPMNQFFRVIVFSLTAAGLNGCGEHAVPYGTERALSIESNRRQIWAIAPAINLSGEQTVDPLLQADLIYQQLQAVRGITVIPVNRVAEVYASLGLEKVQSAEQAAIVRRRCPEWRSPPAISPLEAHSPRPSACSMRPTDRFANRFWTIPWAETIRWARWVLKSIS